MEEHELRLQQARHAASRVVASAGGADTLPKPQGWAGAAGRAAKLLRMARRSSRDGLRPQRRALRRQRRVQGKAE